MITASINPVLYELSYDAFVRQEEIKDPLISLFGPYTLSFSSVEIDCELPSDGVYTLADINVMGLSITDGDEAIHVIPWNKVGRVSFIEPKAEGGTL